MSTTTSGGNKVFVGNLAYETTEEDLKSTFEKAGKVVDSTIVRRGNRSKGFGFVEFSTEEEAQKAVELFDKQDLNDRPINVQVSTSTGTKVGNNSRDNDNDGGYYRNNNNYRNNNYNRNNNYRDNDNDGGYYRNNNRNNNYNDNDDDNYRDNNYRDNNYRDNRGVGRRGGNFRRSPNQDNGGQRRVYFLKNNRYNDDNYNSNRRGNYNNNRRGGYNNNYNRPRNNNNQSRSDVEKVESLTTIFVANLPYDVDDEQLITLFEKCGAIKTAHVVKNRGKSKGYGFVEFEDNDGQKKSTRRNG